MESGDFFLGFDLILSSVKSGLDFVSFKHSCSFFKMSLESVEHSVNFIVDGTGKVRSIDGGYKVFGIKGFSIVVNNDSRNGLVYLIHVFEISKIGGSIFVKINSGIIVTGLEEFFHGVSFEKMFVFSKFVGERRTCFSKDWGFTGGFSSGEFNSKYSNSVEGIFVLFKLLDEELVSFTSGDVKLNKFVVNSFESVGNPIKMVLRVLDFSFNPFSVSGSIFSDFTVSVGNSSKIGDGLSPINLLLFPFSVMFFLFFIDGIL